MVYIIKGTRAAKRYKATLLSACLLSFALCMLPTPSRCGQRSLEQQMRSSTDTLFNQTDSKGRKQGFWKKQYRNGKVAYRAQFRDGRPVGRTQRYNEKGILIADLRHAPSGSLSRAKIYDDEGNLIAVGNYYNQVKDSVWTLYSNGRVVAREGYSRGVKDGTWERYSDGGRLASREQWRNGVLEGRQEEYFANGKLQSFWTAHNGLEDGPSATLYTSGRPRLKGQFVGGLREGVWILYGLDGAAEDTLVFQKGNLIRQSVKSDVDGAIRTMYQNMRKLHEPRESDGDVHSGSPY